MKLDTIGVAELVRCAAKDALKAYLGMCRLDSPWEVPEVFLAAGAAKALAERKLRSAIEFKLNRAVNSPTVEDVQRTPARLQKAYAHLDLAILEDTPNPWDFTIEGIIEFKKHSSLAEDASLIEFMKSKGLSYGVLALLVVGSSPERVVQECGRLTGELIQSARWKFSSESAPSECPPLSDTQVRDRWWDICCLVAV